MPAVNTYTYEELETGLTAEMEHRFSEEHLTAFCEMTNDTHPLHTDRAYAEAHGFEGVIAHGALISSYCSGIIGLYLPGENAIIVSQEFKFRKPLYPGEDIVVRGEIKEKEDRFKTITVAVKVRKKSDQSLVASGSYKVKLRK